MLQTFKNILSKFGVDRAIFYTSLSRVIQAIGGLVTMFLITAFMTKEEQGFYYTFFSVLAIQIFFELGDAKQSERLYDLSIFIRIKILDYE